MRQVLRKKPADLDWIQRQGLLAVKLAQIFALRSDILSVEKCRQLQSLYQHAGQQQLELQGLYATAQQLHNEVSHRNTELVAESTACQNFKVQLCKTESQALHGISEQAITLEQQAEQWASSEALAYKQQSIGQIDAFPEIYAQLKKVCAVL